MALHSSHFLLLLLVVVTLSHHAAATRRQGVATITNNAAIPSVTTTTTTTATTGDEDAHVAAALRRVKHLMAKEREGGVVYPFVTKNPANCSAVTPPTSSSATAATTASSLATHIKIASSDNTNDNGTYTPCVILHGLLDEHDDFDDMVGYITTALPGINVTVLDMLWGLESLTDLWTQVAEFKSALVAVMDEHPEGINLLCFSQGNVICRAILQTTPDHNVQNLIALSGPHLGQFGDTNFTKWLFPHYIRDNLYELFYTPEGQKISIASYWNDPNEQSLYLEQNMFMPFINGIPNATALANSTTQAMFKQGWSKLKNLILIGGPDDGVITPWQAAHFAYYDDEMNVVPMGDQYVYQKDVFGLQTLNSTGRIHEYTIAGVEHMHWRCNETVFNHAILPWFS
eukprot:TRINITY_DN15428_c0_g1_i1.p1 TRINITY_DN15428_c0_g1~~TRINITY_DN15428_c0_g1_i1.p1  ORF type:complete len:401 (+),score=90.29 TRINITY_DN15428_c0_g1_i1:168-1370(+)